MKPAQFIKEMFLDIFPRAELLNKYIYKVVSSRHHSSGVARLHALQWVRWNRFTSTVGLLYGFTMQFSPKQWCETGKCHDNIRGDVKCRRWQTRTWYSKCFNCKIWGHIATLYCQLKNAPRVLNNIDLSAFFMQLNSFQRKTVFVNRERDLCML